MINFQHNVTSSAAGARQPQPTSMDDAQSWAAGHVAAGRLTRAQIADTALTDASISVNDVTTTATQISVGTTTALQIDWNEQTVFCVGRRDVVAGLKLRAVRAHGLHRGLHD